MKIGIDARMFGPKQGGLGRYVEQLILHLEKTDQENDYVIFLNEENFEDYQPRNPRFKKVLAGISWYGWGEQLFLSALIKKQKIDLMHFPHWNVPFFYRGKFVVTIHDLILLHYPSRAASTLGAATYWFKYLFFRLVLRHAIYHAQKIIAPSQFTKNDIVKNFRVPTGKVTVIYEGVVGNQQSAASYQQPVASSQPLGKDFFVADSRKPKTESYILYVGAAYPHKNLSNLIAAFEIFYDKYSKDYKLVLAGPESNFYQKLKLLVSSIKYPVSCIGFVPESELPALYQNASLYVFPSLYEGFGLPGLEALSFGAPVVAAGNSCLPEILGGAALYFNPREPQEIAVAMFEALTNQKLKSQLKAAALFQLKKYSWEKCAQLTLQVYPHIFQNTP